MKRIAVIRILSIVTIFSLLLMIVPVMPAFAVNTITLSPTSGRIGNTVTVTGIFSPAPITETWANIYFSPNNIAVNALITSASTYELVASIQIIDTSIDPIAAGNFTVNFNVPSLLNDGTATQNVTSGTYYIYSTTLTIIGESMIKTQTTFTVTNPTLDPLSPASGPAGQDVAISGSNFPASAALYFNFDTTNLTITQGHTAVLPNGLFLSHITIPASATVGAHTIYVTASGSTVPATFTVTAPAALGALNPASGLPGTPVAISGTGFPASTLIVFVFDSTVLPPVGSTSTGTDGSFASILSIPTNATTGSHTISVTVGSTVKTATFTVTSATTTPAATLNALSPNSGPPGTNVPISGSNFPANSSITVKYDTTTITLSGSTQTGANGSFSGVIVIPSNATAGVHTITVTVGSTSATTNFTVTTTTTTPTTPPPTSTFPLDTQLSGNFVGASISIASSGFSPNSVITVFIDGQNITQHKATESGLFFFTFTLPILKHGEHTVSATDGTKTAAAKFNIESTVPGVPLPLSPAMKEALSAPAYFDWTDVTDASMPVTYNLQIASSANFSPDSIIINKIGLAKSEYTLTEAEQLKLHSEVTYYWREQAIDSALNESPWTGAGEFSMLKPFEFTGWPLYLTLGVGGLVLFLLGLWVGRRTAFYY